MPLNTTCVNEDGTIEIAISSLERFTHGLIWVGFGVKRRPEPPSWSWAGWDGYVAWPLHMIILFGLGYRIDMWVELEDEKLMR